MARNIGMKFIGCGFAIEGKKLIPCEFYLYQGFIDYKIGNMRFTSQHRAHNIDHAKEIINNSSGYILTNRSS